MQIVEIKGEWAKARAGNIEKKINVSFLPQAKIGDYVVIHAGFAISILSPEEAKNALEAYDELGKATS